VSLNVTDRERINPRTRVNVLEQLRLRVWIRHRQGLHPTPMIFAAADNDRVNMIPIPARATQGLKQDGADTFPAHIAICPYVKRLAPAIFTEHACLAEGEKCPWTKQHVHAPYNRHFRTTR